MTDQPTPDAVPPHEPAGEHPAEPAEVLDVGAPPSAPTGTVLPGPPPGDGGGPARPHPRLLRVVGAGVAALAVIGAGGAYAYDRLSGGGPQPTALVPASAAAFVEVDLDPAAGQKVDALRFLRHFPSASSKLGGGADLRRLLAESLLPAVDYATQVEPWLGDRFAVAVVPSATGAPQPEVLVQVTDAARAAEQLPAILAAGGDRAGFVVSGGYAVISSDTSTAQQLVAAAGHAALAQSDGYRSATADLGDGMATLWADLGRVQALGRQVAGAAGLPRDAAAFTGATGTAALRLRFESSAVELVGTVPTTVTATGGPLLLGDLPATTAAAFAASGAGTQLADAGSGALEALATEAGVSPDQLVSLLGSSAVVAVDGDAITSGVPRVAYRAVTGPDALPAAVRLAATLNSATGGLGVTARATPDGVVVATDPGYAAQVAGGSAGTLADDPAFRDALPDVGGAQVGLWVDLAALAPLAGSLDPSSQGDLAPLRALGFTAASHDGTLTVRLRLTVR